ncbi:MAG: ATP-binding protein [Archangium sp.]
MAQWIQTVLAQSAELQRARSLDDLMRVVTSAVRAVSRYNSAWMAWIDPDLDSHVRMLALQGSVLTTWINAIAIPIAGDAMIKEIIDGGRPVIVNDARVDPRTNKDIVGQLGNRTIINVPIVTGGHIRGSLGVGSFGDEGVIPPTEQEIEALTLFATQLAPAFDRIAALDERDRVERERQKLVDHLQSLERVELMGVLSAGVAHDMNNLLSVAMLAVESVGHAKGLDAEDLSAVDDASRALTKMREISRQLLRLGRREEAVRTEIDLNARVASTIKLVQPSIPRGVRVLHERDGSPLIEGDGVQLEQALANLVLNARDAVGDRGVITLRVDERQLQLDALPPSPRSRPGRFAHVRVTDTGPGLTEEMKNHIFDPLFTTKPTGTGLGLAVVSRVTEQHQGFVAVESEPGRGTSFDLYFPAL